VAADPRGTGTSSWRSRQAPVSGTFCALRPRRPPGLEPESAGQRQRRALAVAPDGTVVVAARFARGPDIFDMWLAKYSPGRPQALEPDRRPGLPGPRPGRGGRPRRRRLSRGEPLGRQIQPRRPAALEAHLVCRHPDRGGGRDGSLYLAGSALRKYSPEGKVIWTRPLPPGLGEIAGADRLGRRGLLHGRDGGRRVPCPRRRRWRDSGPTAPSPGSGATTARPAGRTPGTASPPHGTDDLRHRQHRGEGLRDGGHLDGGLAPLREVAVDRSSRRTAQRRRRGAGRRDRPGAARSSRRQRPRPRSPLRLWD